MRKLIAFEFLSLDGLMAGRQNHEMDWVKDNFIKEMTNDLSEEYQDIDTFLFGRVTYESLSNYWPHASVEKEPLTDLINNMNKIVFSSKLIKTEWKNSTLIRGDIKEEVSKMKEQKGKDMMIIGSASIMQTLTNYGLIDEYKFLLFPIVLGMGKPLFVNIEQQMNLKAEKIHTYDNGVIKISYSLKKK